MHHLDKQEIAAPLTSDQVFVAVLCSLRIAMCQRCVNAPMGPTDGSKYISYEHSVGAERELTTV